MSVKTKNKPIISNESFDTRDRAEIHNIITNLRKSYTDRLADASDELHRSQRQANRASHEVTRLKKHLERIDNFCKNNEIEVGDL